MNTKLSEMSKNYRSLPHGEEISFVVVENGRVVDGGRGVIDGNVLRRTPMTRKRKKTKVVTPPRRKVVRKSVVRAR